MFAIPTMSYCRLEARTQAKIVTVSVGFASYHGEAGIAPADLVIAHDGDLAQRKALHLHVRGGLPRKPPLGTREDVASYTLSPAIRVHWLEGGDHSFKPPARSGRTEAQNVAEAIAAAADFVESLPG